MNTKKQNKKKKGFTLIELIIVIAIIAILAAIAIPNFLGIQRKSKIKSDIASAKTIYDATSAAIAEGKIIPTSTGVTLVLSSKDENADYTTLKNYLQTIPTPKYQKGYFAVNIKADNNNKPEINVGQVDKEDATKIGTEIYPNGTDVYDINGDGTGNTAQK